MSAYKLHYRCVLLRAQTVLSEVQHGNAVCPLQIRHLSQASFTSLQVERKENWVAAGGRTENKSDSFKCNDMLWKMLSSNVKYL